MTMTMATASRARPVWAVADIVTFPDFRHTELLLEARIKNEVQPSLKLDSDSQICRAHLSPSGCPLGAGCPKRHTNPSPLNYTQPPAATSAHSRTVCKHWLRGLCKKGSDCEFLHEYNLRKMPECWFFTKHGFCSSGDECMYLHITPHQRRPECRSYTAGFCRAGPECPDKHIRKVACPLYLVGFCPNGQECLLAHPPFLVADVERGARQSEQARQKAGGDVYRNRDRDWPTNSHHQLHSYASATEEAYSRPGVPVSGDVNIDVGGFAARQGGFGGGGRGRGRGVPPTDSVGFLKGVVCFKCTQPGHLASHCPNPAVPGNRGGVERGPGGRALHA